MRKLKSEPELHREILDPIREKMKKDGVPPEKLKFIEKFYPVKEEKEK